MARTIVHGSIAVLIRIPTRALRTLRREPSHDSVCVMQCDTCAYSRERYRARVVAKTVALAHRGLHCQGS